MQVLRGLHDIVAHLGTDGIAAGAETRETVVGDVPASFATIIDIRPFPRLYPSPPGRLYIDIGNRLLGYDILISSQ